MKVSSLLLVALVALCAGQAVLAKKAKWHKPEFCGHSECPPYTVDEDREKYEIRTYDAGVWAVTNVTDNKYELAYTKASARLIKYFKGANSDKISMDMTVPTLASLMLKDDNGTKKNQETERDYSFSMWIHPDYQDDAPEATDENLELVEFDEVTVYVRPFGGFATEATILQEVEALKKDLNDDKVDDYDEDIVFVAVYDPAVKLFNRHNEVSIYKKKSKPSILRQMDVVAES